MFHHSRSPLLMSSIIALSGFVPAPAQAQTFLFQENVSPTPGYQMGATFARGINATGNNDRTGFLYVGNPGDNFKARSFLSFDLSALPDGTTLSSVNLTLQSNGFDTASISANVPIELRLLTSSFNEATLTWDNQPTNTTLLASFTANPTTIANNTLVTWTSTPAFLAAAQAAADANGTLNFAVKIADANEVQTSVREAFFFTDDDQGGTGAFHPQLSVTVVPAPSALATLLLGAVPGIGMLIRRRRK